MKQKTATFIGHSHCNNIDTHRLNEEIKSLILQGYNQFFCGGMGDFDRLCALTTKKYKKQFPDIKICLVIPYLSFNSSDFEYYDEIIYPEGFENYFFKSAIVKRNRYMVENSSYAICYVNHYSNGAGKTFAYAKKCGIPLINLGRAE